MRLKWIMLAGGTALLVVAGIIGLKWFNQPVIGTEVQSAITTEPSPSAPADREVDSSYFFTRVSGNLEVRSRQGKTSTAILERHIFGSGIDEGDRLAITIGAMPPGGLKEVPDVRLRENNTSLYTAVTPEYLPSNAKAFTSRVDTYEEVVFLSNGKQYASVVVTGRTDRSEVLQSLLETTVTNWQWRS